MNEPSVEEILGSIKKIIAENEQERRKSVPRSVRRKSADAQTPDVGDDILDLADLSADMDENLSVSRPHNRNSIESFDDSESDEAETPLMADAAAQSVRHSIAALTALSTPGAEPQIVRSGETSLEGMVRQMLRPMMKNWLDENLPSLVEEIVAREVTRITRGK